MEQEKDVKEASITFKLSQKEKEALVRMAKEQERSLSQLLRLIIQKQINNL